MLQFGGAHSHQPDEDRGHGGRVLGLTQYRETFFYKNEAGEPRITWSWGQI